MVGWRARSELNDLPRSCLGRSFPAPLSFRSHPRQSSAFSVVGTPNFSARTRFLVLCVSSFSWSILFLFIPFASLPDEPMPAEGEPTLGQPALPAVAGADGGGVVEQAVAFFMAGEARELGRERMMRREERFLAVEYRWVGALGVVEAIDLPRPERELDAPQQGRVRVGLEIGIDQVRDLARMPVQLDQVRSLDRAEIRPGAALVHPQQRLERVERLEVNINGVRQELADRGALARHVHGLSIPRTKQQVIRLAAGFGVVPKECPDLVEVRWAMLSWAGISTSRL